MHGYRATRPLTYSLRLSKTFKNNNIGKHHTEGEPQCSDYDFSTPKCQTACDAESHWPIPYAQDKIKFSRAYSLYGEQDMMKDLYENGPMSVSYNVYVFTRFSLSLMTLLVLVNNSSVYFFSLSLHFPFLYYSFSMFFFSFLQLSRFHDLQIWYVLGPPNPCSTGILSDFSIGLHYIDLFSHNFHLNI